MPKSVAPPPKLSLYRAISALCGILMLAACSTADDAEGEAREASDRPAAVPVLLTEAVPAGVASGTLSGLTAQRFRLSGTRDFLIEKGSRVDGQYELAYLPEEAKWRLSVDWYGLSAKGVSRIRNIGRHPPFYTQENLEGSPDISPALSRDMPIPMRLFTLRSRRLDFDRIILMPDVEE